MALLNFKHGLQANLTANSPAIVEGTVYITRDEHAMYVDLPEYKNGETVLEGAKRIRIGDMRTFNSIQAMKNAIENDMNTLTESALYFAKYQNEGDTQPINALLKWTGTDGGFVQLNTTSELSTNLSNLQTSVSELTETVNGHTTAIEGIVGENGSIETISGNIDSITDRLDVLEGDDKTEGSVAHSVKAAVDSLNQAINGKVDTSTFNGLSNTVNTKFEEVNTKFGEVNTSIGNLSTELGSYKTSNDAALKKTNDDLTQLGKDLAAEIQRSTEKDNAVDTAIDGLDGRLDVVEVFFNSVDNSTEIVDTLKEIQTFINTDETTASAMLADIQQNKDDISDIKENYATTEALNGAVTSLEGKITKAEKDCKKYTDDKLTWSQF